MCNKKTDLTIRAREIGMLKCKINNIEVAVTTPVLFQAMPGWNGDRTDVRVQDSLVMLKKGVNQ